MKGSYSLCGVLCATSKQAGNQASWKSWFGSSVGVDVYVLSTSLDSNNIVEWVIGTGSECRLA